MRLFSLYAHLKNQSKFPVSHTELLTSVSVPLYCLILIVLEFLLQASKVKISVGFQSPFEVCMKFPANGIANIYSL